MNAIDILLQNIAAAPDTSEAVNELRERILKLTMPTRALGRALDLAEELTVAAGQLPAIDQPHIAVFAGEHGVVEEGVSAYPAEVTRQMVLNFLGEGAAINQLARDSGANLMVVNVATGGTYPESELLMDQPVAAHSANLLHEPALTEDAMNAALALGMSVVERAVADGADIFVAGEMGIGNTTPSACLAVALTGCGVDAAVGRGTGLDDAALAKKRRVVKEALGRPTPRPESPLDWLREWGGYEHAAITGAALACAVHRLPFVVDGFNVAASVAVAVALAPRVSEVLIASHRGSEPGHGVLLDHLGKRAYLEWGLRLGEGSGAALMIPLCRLACRTVRDMATFDEAGVSGREPGAANA